MMINKLILIFLISFSAQAKEKSALKHKTAIKNPFGLRDPFKAPLTKSEAKTGFAGKKRSDGTYTNVPLLKRNVQLSSIKVVGVLVGANRRAIIKIGNGGRSFTLKEGMKIGTDNAELKAILPGGLVFVEKITNVYGQDEYLETIIPISR